MKEEIKTTNYTASEEIENDVQMSVQGLAAVSGKLKEDVVKLHPSEIRFIVDAYYQKQDDRKTKFHQIRSIQQGADDGYGNQLTMLQWLANSSKNEEAQIKKLLDLWTDGHPIGRYLKDITGIGPVFSAALLSYFDISKAHYYGNFVSYAGLADNNIKWLGTEKANKLVSYVFDEYEDFIDPVIDKFFDSLDKDKLTKLIKRITKDMSDDEIIMMIDDETEYMDAERREKAESYREKLDKLNFLRNEMEVCDVYEEQFGEYKAFSVVFTEMASWITSNSNVSSWIVMRIANLSNRKYENVMKGLSNLIKTKKGKKSRYFTKSDLQSQMARPPYNLKLKTIMYLIGDSFMKRSNHPNSLYGKLYKQRKAYELYKNDRGDYAQEAANILKEKSFRNKEVKEIYESGKLPAGHIELRARRWAVKIFISHLFEIMYMYEYNAAPPKAFPIAHLGHYDYIPPEIPYKNYIKVPKEYYEMYPGIYDKNGNLIEGAEVQYIGHIHKDKKDNEYHWGDMVDTGDWDMEEYVDWLDDWNKERNASN